MCSAAPNQYLNLLNSIIIAVRMDDDISTLIDVSVVYTYQTHAKALQCFRVPATMVTACTRCSTAFAQDCCLHCGSLLCSLCQETHACYCTRCGAVNACWSASFHGEALCKSCGSHPDYCFTVYKTPTQRARATKHPESKGNRCLQFRMEGERRREATTFATLQKAWVEQNDVMTQIASELWVQLAPIPELSLSCRNGNDNDNHMEQSVHAFVLLAAALAWDFPSGVAAFHMDIEKCVVCVPSRPAHSVHVNTALSWLRKMKSQVLGIAIRAVGDTIQAAVVYVGTNAEQDVEVICARKRKALLAAWSTMRNRFD